MYIRDDRFQARCRCCSVRRNPARSRLRPGALISRHLLSAMTTFYYVNRTIQKSHFIKTGFMRPSGVSRNALSGSDMRIPPVPHTWRCALPAFVVGRAQEAALGPPIWFPRHETPNRKPAQWLAPSLSDILLSLSRAWPLLSRRTPMRAPDRDACTGLMSVTVMPDSPARPPPSYRRL